MDGCAGSRVRVMHAGTAKLPASRFSSFSLLRIFHPCCTSFLPCASHSAALPSYPGFSGMWGRGPVQ